jgi:XTP/dITP diphosphohydrolase
MILLVATTNTGKLREIRALLAGLTLDLKTLADFRPVEAPQETGRTFAENARIKAVYYARAFGQLTVAEDSGLEVDRLGGAPGVESARLGGEGSSYPQKFALIYERLGAAGHIGSPARFVCALALARGSDLLFEARGTIEGRIALEPKGTEGFGYDPIFFYPPFGCTLAEAGDRKSEVSHRAAAFRQLRQFLESENLELKT